MQQAHRAGISVDQVMRLKAALRKEMRRRLVSLSAETQRIQSEHVWAQLRDLPVFQSSKRVAVYLSVAGEIETRPIVTHLLTTPEKACYVPYTNGATGEMRMLHVRSLEDLDSFDTNNKWGIPEPPVDTVKDRTEGMEGDGLDLILVPGLAFSSSGRRLGKGKGYYDKYLAQAEHIAHLQGRPRPYLIGLSFVEQVEEDIPTLPHDRTVDLVLTMARVTRDT